MTPASGPREYLGTAALAVVFAWTATLADGCAHSPHKTTPELSQLDGKKVALVDIEGEATARSVVEVALINQLVKRGTFILISKQDVKAAREAPEQNPADWLGVARRAGAEYALRAQVLEFTADTREGYSSETVEDSQLAAERGEAERMTTRVFKAKALDGKVRVRLDFADLSAPVGKVTPDSVRTGIAEQSARVEADEQNAAIHLPPKLQFLEKLANEAFRDFFERYN